MLLFELFSRDPYDRRACNRNYLRPFQSVSTAIAHLPSDAVSAYEEALGIA